MQSPLGCAKSTLSGATLFVTDRGNDTIDEWAATTTGNVAPATQIGGSNSNLMRPSALAVDAARNVFVANALGTAVYIFAPGSSGNATPTVLAAGGIFVGVNGLAVDTSGNLYVADSTGNAIYVFAPGATGNAAPTRTITGSNTGLFQVKDVAVDSAGVIYAVTGAGTAVLEFAAGANGNATPTQLTGAATQLTAAYFIAIDPTGRIIVPQAGTGVRVFAAGSVGNVAPVATISGSMTGLTNALGVGTGPTGTIYVVNSAGEGGPAAVLGFASSANGNVPPIFAISGSCSTLSGPITPVVR